MTTETPFIRGAVNVMVVDLSEAKREAYAQGAREMRGA